MYLLASSIFNVLSEELSKVCLLKFWETASYGGQLREGGSVVMGGYLEGDTILCGMFGMLTTGKKN